MPAYEILLTLDTSVTLNPQISNFLLNKVEGLNEVDISWCFWSNGPELSKFIVWSNHNNGSKTIRIWKIEPNS